MGVSVLGSKALTKIRLIAKVPLVTLLTLLRGSYTKGVVLNWSWRGV